MTTVRELEQSLFAWAPRAQAMEWDNVGLLVGDGSAEVKRVLVALDITEAVGQEAKDWGAELIVSHHPLLHPKWYPMATLCPDTAHGRLLTGLLRDGISAICMHTNLDAADGGVNDLLAEAVGLRRIAAFNDEKIGRIGQLDSEIHLEQFLTNVVQSLGCRAVRYRDNGKPVHRVAVGGGACGEYVRQVVELGCDTFLTSDLKYHDFLDCTACNLIDAGHFATENLICGAIVRRLRESFPVLEFKLSTSHQDVIQYYW